MRLRRGATDALTPYEVIHNFVQEYVSSYFASVGLILEYVLDPSFMGTKIRPGTEMSDVQTSLQALAVIGLTSLEMPKLLNDFSHICLDEKGIAAFARFQEPQW